ncbi:MAG: peptidylprolyl isomerase [Victivallaceae bacterium]
MKKMTFGFLVAGAMTSIAIGADTAPVKVDAAPAVAPAKKVEAVAEAPKDMWAFLPEELAEINGKKLSKKEFVDYFTASLPGGKLPPMINEQMLQQIAPRIIKKYVERMILMNAAEKAGFKPSAKLAEENFRRALKEAKPQELDGFKHSLEAKGMTVDQFITQNAAKPSVQENAAIDEWLSKTVVANIKISESEVKDFYDKNLERFKMPGDAPDAIRASHILIMAKEPKDDAAAKAKIEAILERIKKGESFEAIAQAESECPSGKMAKGSLGAFGKGQMVKPFEDAAMALKPGEISGVVKTQFGYHIIRRDQPQNETVKSFAEVKELIENTLKAKIISKDVEEMIKKLETEQHVKIFVKEVAPKTEVAPKAEAAPKTEAAPKADK